MSKEQDATIFEEQARVLAHVTHPGDQYIMRLHAPKTAARAKPGQFVHLRVSPERPLRRPISIMLTDPEHGTIDLLYKAIGEGTQLLTERKAGDLIPMLGPIGVPFDLSDHTKRYVLIGGGVGIPPMIFAADQLQGKADCILFAGSEVEFPFALKPSTTLLPGINGNAILTIRSLEERGIPSRLASNAGLYGCYEGHVPNLARDYLQALRPDERARCVLLSCGPHPMLHAVAKLGRELEIPTFLSLEEHMACGIGGCAGCVVKTLEEGQEKYRRVCVDGPVFAAELLPEFA
ncbi:dihydroorotate dehydrogenase electron transfer subunit [Mariprofundus ferrooxydans]|uniref:Oxidoreductase FAD/NAD(P)-binding protein n=1 Tax=Mariprofundus ferrooxydans PV-1 TaxID=314345 RepID=Q0EWZ9_9PROT|nr:dihydroorotate dehydrogenase electron transfer subunit [Mariprofundus ferrooxydans]EAU53758.1 Oxidoreductase FAD/NAD(P)-binding protein [Mariprofundus ferrooxydans PV-1]KON47510.1 oxidoreductase [Mariprofundus ferrooxydans]